jgi:hypothetical protein
MIYVNVSFSFSYGDKATIVASGSASLKYTNQCWSLLHFVAKKKTLMCAIDGLFEP